jgi:hypothetical protein
MRVPSLHYALLGWSGGPEARRRASRAEGLSRRPGSLHGGEGTHRVAMRGKSSLCWRCAQVSGDNWGSQVSRRLPEGLISRHSVHHLVDLPIEIVPEELARPFVHRAL